RLGAAVLQRPGALRALLVGDAVDLQVLESLIGRRRLLDRQVGGPLRFEEGLVRRLDAGRQARRLDRHLAPRLDGPAVAGGDDPPRRAAVQEVLAQAVGGLAAPVEAAEGALDVLHAGHPHRLVHRPAGEEVDEGRARRADAGYGGLTAWNLLDVDAWVTDLNGHDPSLPPVAMPP